MHRNLDRLRPDRGNTPNRGALAAHYFWAWNVAPHRFRHATAVHLVAAGVDITVIRSWLGHVSLDTTNHYAQANLQTKRKALERVGVRSKAGKLPRWRRDRSILDWLDSL